MKPNNLPKNKEATRYFSSIQERYIANNFNGILSSNSGAATFSAGDVLNKDASLLIECKTCMTEKKSFSIKKEWIKKNREEAFTQRVFNGCIAFNFGPEQENFFVIDEKLMKFLIEKLEEENRL